MSSFHSDKLTTSFPFTQFFSKNNLILFCFFLISFNFAYFTLNSFHFFKFLSHFFYFFHFQRHDQRQKALSPSNSLCDTSKNIWHPSNTSDFQFSIHIFHHFFNFPRHKIYQQIPFHKSVNIKVKRRGLGY